MIDYSKISIVIPSKNEEKAIGKILKNIKKITKNKSQIIVVDSSTDKTPEIARKMKAIVINEPRKGYGRAYKTGFKYATKDIVITCDADCTYPVEKIPLLVDILIKNNLDFISCHRILKKNSMSLLNRIGNKMLTLIINILFNVNLKDSQSGMWVFKRSLLKKIKLKENGMPLSTEIKLEAKKNGKFLEYPVPYRKRIGKAKLQSLKDGFRILRFVLNRKLSII